MVCYATNAVIRHYRFNKRTNPSSSFYWQNAPRINACLWKKKPSISDPNGISTYFLRNVYLFNFPHQTIRYGGPYEIKTIKLFEVRIWKMFSIETVLPANRSKLSVKNVFIVCSMTLHGCTFAKRPYWTHGRASTMCKEFVARRICHSY